MFDELFADTEWVGTDVSLDESLCKATKDGSVYVSRSW